jgi:hypothetical protein
MPRLIEAARALAGASPSAIVAGLLAALSQFSAGTASIDDATIAVLRYQPR